MGGQLKESARRFAFACSSFQRKPESILSLRLVFTRRCREHRHSELFDSTRQQNQNRLAPE